MTGDAAHVPPITGSVLDGLTSLVDADLIVVGVRGRNAVDLALFGSTTNQVVRAAECPVLTVRS